MHDRAAVQITGLRGHGTQPSANGINRALQSSVIRKFVSVFRPSETDKMCLLLASSPSLSHLTLFYLGFTGHLTAFFFVALERESWHSHRSIDRLVCFPLEIVPPHEHSGRRRSEISLMDPPFRNPPDLLTTPYRTLVVRYGSRRNIYSVFFGVLES
jgi:hypothetical protein